MKIKAIRTYSKDLGTSRPYTIAYKTVTEVINAFVEVELENGIIGIGAANPSQYVVNESVEDTIQSLSENVLDYLIGQDIRAFQGVLSEVQNRFRDTPGVNVAIDVALHDAYTQFLGIPLTKYFGQHHEKMATSVTIGIKNVEETVKESKEYAEAGYRIIKVKTGLNPEEDAERVIKIQESFPDLVIRVDANQGYTPTDLIKFVELSEKVSLDLIEQPFPVEKFIENSDGIPAKEAALLVADESLRNSKDAFELIAKAPNCRIFNIKLMKTGGLLEANKIADIATLGGARLMWGCNDESAVSISAALHLAMAYPHTGFIDLDGSLDLLDDAVTGGFEIRDGYMYPMLNSGLGVTIKH